MSLVRIIQIGKSGSVTVDVSEYSTLPDKDTIIISDLVRDAARVVVVDRGASIAESTFVTMGELREWLRTRAVEPKKNALDVPTGAQK